jgi:hypothetical protein
MSAESNRRQKLCRDAGCFCTREGFNKEIAQLREALTGYVKAQSRMLERWADADLDVRRQLWQELHVCEYTGRTALEYRDD